MLRMFFALFVVELALVFSAEAITPIMGSCDQLFEPVHCSNTQEKFYQGNRVLPTNVCHADRARKAAMLLRSLVGETPQRILDLGAGCGDVHRYVAGHDAYTPSDLRTREFPVIECNYNAGLFPHGRQWTVVFALGVMEYMCDPVQFIRALRSYNTSVILSYTASDINPIGTVIALANYLPTGKLEELMADGGFEIKKHITPKLRYDTKSGDSLSKYAMNSIYFLYPRQSPARTSNATVAAQLAAVRLFDSVPGNSALLRKNDARSGVVTTSFASVKGILPAAHWSVLNSDSAAVPDYASNTRGVLNP